MIGELFCYVCPEPQFVVDETPIGDLMQSTALRDVVGRVQGGWFKLACGHLHFGMMTSAQEWILEPDGTKTTGHMALQPTRRS